jgi:hypothetical protein
MVRAAIGGKRPDKRLIDVGFELQARETSARSP